MTSKKHKITAPNAETIALWLMTRGGIAIWRSVNLADPDRSWTCPVNGPDGKPAGKPSWMADGKPERIITASADIEVETPKEVARFHVAVLRGGQGFSYKCTDASTKRIQNAVAKATKRYGNAWYEFDYATQEAVIFAPEKIMPLDDFLAHQLVNNTPVLEMTDMTLEQLQAMPTISQGQTADLKVDTGTERVWLSRCGVADGEPYPNKVTVELWCNNKWTIASEYQAK